ncbi:MAG: hypothetical protein IPL61_22820 [Myxococcales bacterium]|nr:hypothetical protein [Myxococcales bacterium]
MNVAHADEPGLTAPMTWDEIRARYPDEWVCLVEIGWLDDSNVAFATARVAGHGKTSRAPLDQARPLWGRYREIGHYFTGKVVRPSPGRLL